MYSEKLVVAVKANGKILREHKDSVYVPFGHEYSLLIKNKNSLRALVRVEIDGVDATQGTRLIVPANGSLDLERFIKEGNFDQGNRFKFIERTKKIEDGPRGIGAEDGLIRVEFEFEREPAPMKAYNQYDSIFKDALARHTRQIGDASGPEVLGPYYSLNAVGQAGLVGQVTFSSATYSANHSQTFATTGETLVPQNAALLNDVGITVPGSVSDQKFVAGTWFPTDGVKHVMILKLLGEVEGKPVEKPVTVKAKPTCVTCGTVNKANAKFCRECGTALTIL